jgi:hypothetical protein
VKFCEANGKLKYPEKSIRSAINHSGIKKTPETNPELFEEYFREN